MRSRNRIPEGESDVGPEGGLNPYWETVQPGLKFASQVPGSPGFFREVEHRRYRLEPHIPQIVRFAEWSDQDVLEVGCGIGTDGIQFARAGARYTGVDQAQEALRLAAARFLAEGLPARFVRATATDLPFGEQFDLVYSHGVLHHLADPNGAVAEALRVLRPSGRAIIMLYHRHSLNYLVNIMLLRRLLALTLLAPGMPQLIAALTGEPVSLLMAHRQLLRTHGARYLLDAGLFLSNNTDGPGNPLSKVFTRRAARDMMMDAGFAEVRTTVRYLNLRVYPGGERLSSTRPARWLERRSGWHLYMTGMKDAT